MKEFWKRKVFFTYHILCIAIIVYSLYMVCLVHESYYNYYSRNIWGFPSLFKDPLMRSPMKILFGGSPVEALFNSLIIPAAIALYLFCRTKKIYFAHCITSLFTLLAYLIMDDFRQGFAYYWYGGGGGGGGGGGKSIILTHVNFFSVFCQIATSLFMQLISLIRFSKLII